MKKADKVLNDLLVKLTEAYKFRFNNIKDFANYYGFTKAEAVAILNKNI